MPRSARILMGEFVYHVVNRGNGRARVFHDDGDYAEFLKLLPLASERTAMRLLAFCLMPNHFHLVLWPYGDHDVGHWMQWLLTTQVRRHHERHGTCGRLWQGRFGSFPVQQDDHLLAVLRYVERNALTANLVERAEDWRWGSLAARVQGNGLSGILAKSPVELRADWRDWVNLPISGKDLDALRFSTKSGRPYGHPSWLVRTAGDLGLRSTLRPPGRPRSGGNAETGNVPS